MRYSNTIPAQSHPRDSSKIVYGSGFSAFLVLACLPNFPQFFLKINFFATKLDQCDTEAQL